METDNTDIYELNLGYLIKAREMVMSGRPHQAMVKLGLTPDAVRLLPAIPIRRLQTIAQRDMLCFAPRFAPGCWREILMGGSKLSDEDSARRLILLVGGGSNGVPARQ